METARAGWVRVEREVRRHVTSTVTGSNSSFMAILEVYVIGGGLDQHMEPVLAIEGDFVIGVRQRGGRKGQEAFLPALGGLGEQTQPVLRISRKGHPGAVSG